ncbi:MULTISPECIES: response regulator transcription factor [Olivibacter]|jgi:DNA-binding response OmpR family regulator|uniref:Two component transcriptional regulator, winged helix family n=3 Tax=Sphingobacteriaceae TaxID=84566 RepID=F4C6Z7_SPHS2|nr:MULTISPECIES: response regulator transcription factor [Olivibacter]MCL4637569.1 response regulator transcription factor [Olivibacter sp. UJ_SKK_5.1]MDM8175212.1 response regulator transcription factor [Olivibacter sp. 47]MDX3913111.1 response regulator transcription factor [Pseudosphingobacterium sp.]QEL01978.1 response regulator transcription factor [Olivibacter sp. LS-1]
MHILIIEDESRIAQLLQRGLEELGYKTTVAYDGILGKKLVWQQAYDLIIMDIILPKINGIDLCREIKESYPDLPIIMLTALGTTDDKLEGFDAGADDYLVKPFDFRELEARIRVLLKRGSASNSASTAILKAGELEMNLHTRIVKRGNVEINLTPKEFKLLEYMIRNKGRVLPRVEIAEKVWDTTFDTGTNFIDVYINYLRNKIDKAFEEKYIHTKPGMGFIFKTE